MGTRKEVNSGSVGLSKGMSRHVFFSGSARGEGRRWCVAKLLPDEFWPASDTVWGLLGATCTVGTFILAGNAVLKHLRDSGKDPGFVLCISGVWVAIS